MQVFQIERENEFKVSAHSTLSDLLCYTRCHVRNYNEMTLDEHMSKLIFSGQHGYLLAIALVFAIAAIPPLVSSSQVPTTQMPISKHDFPSRQSLKYYDTVRMEEEKSPSIGKNPRERFRISSASRVEVYSTHIVYVLTCGEKPDERKISVSVDIPTGLVRQVSFTN